MHRLIVNACYWAVGLEKKIRPDAKVGLVGDYQPSPFKFRRLPPNRRPVVSFFTRMAIVVSFFISGHHFSQDLVVGDQNSCPANFRGQRPAGGAFQRR
jgi:hypothetical protein